VRAALRGLADVGDVLVSRDDSQMLVDAYTWDVTFRENVMPALLVADATQLTGVNSISVARAVQANALRGNFSLLWDPEDADRTRGLCSESGQADLHQPAFASAAHAVLFDPQVFERTWDLPWDASAAQVQHALDALVGVRTYTHDRDPANALAPEHAGEFGRGVSVSRAPWGNHGGFRWHVTFLANSGYLPLLQADARNLRTSATVPAAPPGSIQAGAQADRPFVRVQQRVAGSGNAEVQVVTLRGGSFSEIQRVALRVDSSISASEVQRLQCTASGGSLALTFHFSLDANQDSTKAGIPADSTPAALETLLESLAILQARLIKTS